MVEQNDICGFEKLLVYQKSIEFITLVYEFTKKFPQDEIFGLTSQFRRAANSIALNIGEGSVGTPKENLTFLRISRRSANECIVCTTISIKNKYISDSEHNDLRKRSIEISKMLVGLMKSVSNDIPTKKTKRISENS